MTLGWQRARSAKGAEVTEQRVRVGVADHVATVTLARPDKHNALDAAMFRGILDAAAEVAATPGVRVAVLHGEGRSFCSGLDVSALGSDDGLSPLDLDAREGRANLPQRACTDWIDLAVPVIAAIHGNCFGGGLQIALGADLRFAAPDARLSVREIQWGLVPDMGITSTLPRLVPIDVAKELTFTGRTISGAEAAELGVVTHVADDPLAAAHELAREIAGRSPDAVRAAKRLFDRSWNAPVEDGLLLETELQVGLIGGSNQIAAVVAGMNGKDPEFVDPAAGRSSESALP
jgi:enoyl-CoA hydratase/carnithine racemase